MNFLDQILAADWITRLGWTLLHSLWEIALVAAVLALLLSALRRGSANMRYLAACGGLAIMAIVPILTFSVLPESQAPDITAAAPAEETTPKDIAATEDIAAVPAEDIAAVEKGMENTGVFVSGHPGEEPPVTSPPITAVASAAPQPTAEEPATDKPQESSLQRIAAVLSPWMPWCVVAWFVGVFVVSVWNLGGWIAAQRLKHLGTTPVALELLRRLSTLAERSGINRSVAMMKSLMVEVPVAVGWLRPMILLPAGILTGLTPAELDAILAHELAHIRRHDYLVNLLQTVIETLLFYHPGVWWLSRQIRAEREHCCDDMAVAVCGDKIDYASALAAVEAGRSAPKMVMAARKADSSTLGRIRRILGFAGNGPRRWRRSLSGGLITSAMIVALVTCFVVAGERTDGDASTTESEESIARLPGHRKEWETTSVVSPAVNETLAEEVSDEPSDPNPLGLDDDMLVKIYRAGSIVQRVAHDCESFYRDRDRLPKDVPDQATRYQEQSRASFGIDLFAPGERLRLIHDKDDSRRVQVWSVGPDGDWDGGRQIDSTKLPLDGDLGVEIRVGDSDWHWLADEGMKRHLKGERLAHYLAAKGPKLPRAEPKDDGLKWGPVVDGLQAAVELSPKKEAFSLGETIAVRFHVRNAADYAIQVGLQTGGWQDMTALIHDAAGQPLKERGGAFGTGTVAIIQHTLKPGGTAAHPATSLVFVAPGKRPWAGSVGHSVEAVPGVYTVQFQQDFPMSFRADPREWQGVLKTAPVTVRIAAEPKFAIHRVRGYRKQGDRPGRTSTIIFRDGGNPERFDSMKPERYPLKDLVLDGTPLITESDVTSYHWERHLVQLTPEAYKRLMETVKPSVWGVPFVVRMGGEPIYMGAFWTRVSSYTADMPTISLDRHYEALPESHPNYLPVNAIRIENSQALEEGEPSEDPRQDGRLCRAFLKTGQLAGVFPEVPPWGKAVEGVRSRLHPGWFRDGEQWLIFELGNDSSDLSVQLGPGGMPTEILVDDVAYAFSGEIAGRCPDCKPGQSITSGKFKLDKNWTPTKTVSGPGTLELKPGKHTVQAAVYATGKDENNRDRKVRVLSNAIEIEIAADPKTKNIGKKPKTKNIGKKNVAWGETVDGLQAGVTTAFEYPRPYKVGTNVPLKFLLRNTTDKPITLTHARVPVFINWNNYRRPPGPQLLDPDGEQVFPASGVGGRGLPGAVERTIAPGEVITMTTTRLPLRPEGWKGTTVNLLTYLVGPGTHQVSMSHGFGDEGGKHWGGTVTTGALDLYVHTGNQPLSLPGIAWGRETEGVRCRLNVDKARLRPGEPPILLVDLQNHHTKRAMEQSWHSLAFKLEVDGKWTGKIAPMSVDGPVGHLTPGQEWINVPLVLEDNQYYMAGTDSEPGGPAKFSELLGPGRHTIRVDIDGVISNPVKIEIVPDLPDGIYSIRGINSTEPGVEVARSDADGTVVLLHRLTDNFGTASMASIANDNSRFRIDFHAAGPFAEHSGVSHLALLIDGLCVMAGAQNLDKDRRMDLTAWLWLGGKEVPARIAAKLGITPALRKHPGHKMAASFSPTKKAFKPGEPIVLNMTVKNVGDRPISFVDGGRQRGPRNNQFAFTAFRNGGTGPEVPDTGDPTNFGGLGTFITLKPGEVFQKQIDIAKWFDLAKPDTYKINCRFEMEISDNWDDVAEGTVMVVVADQEDGLAEVPWSKPVEGVACAVRPVKASFAPGDDVVVDVMYRNVSDEPVTVCVCPDPLYTWIHVSVKTAEGRSVMAGQHGTGTRPPLKLADFVTLEPQHTASFRQVIGSSRHPEHWPKPGRYFLHAEINKINRIDEHLPGYDEICKKHGLTPWVGEIEVISNPVAIKLPTSATAGSEAAPSAVYGHVIERMFDVDAPKDGAFVDLETGEAAQVPEEVRKDNSGQKMLAWAGKNGIDLSVRVRTGPVCYLGSIDCFLTRSRDTDWRKTTAADVLTNRELRDGELGFGNITKRPADLPAVYMFKTREGGVGLLQIAEFTKPAEDVAGVTVRYKLLQAAETMAAWSNPVDGLRTRLRPTQRQWKSGNTPTLALDLWNDSSQDKKFLYLGQQKAECEIEVDGQWFRWADTVAITQAVLSLKAGQSRDEAVKISLTRSWARTDEPMYGRPVDDSLRLNLTPGKHTLRVAFTPDGPDHREKRPRIVSLPVEIEIAPDDNLDVESLKKLGWRPMEKTNLIWDNGGRISSIDIFAPSRDVDVTDAWLAPLKGMTELRMLSLTGTQLTDAGLVHLRRLANLRELRLQNTRIGDAGLAHLSGLTKLEWLELTGTQVSNAGLIHLEGLTNLKSLFLDSTRVTKEGAEKLKRVLPNTKVFFGKVIGIDGSPPPATDLPSPNAKNEDTAKIELKLGSDKTKTISVALGQSAVDIHNLCRPAKVCADDDPWLAAMAAGGGSYVFLFAAEGTPEEMRGRLDPRRDKLYAVLRYPTDSKDNGTFLLPGTMQDKTYGDFVTMKVPLGLEKAKAATVALGMSTEEVKHLFPSAPDLANEDHAVVFDSVYDDNKYLLLFTPQGDGTTHNPKLDKLAEVIYRHGDKPETIYLLPRNKRGKPVAAEHRKLLKINGSNSGTGNSTSDDSAVESVIEEATPPEEPAWGEAVDGVSVRLTKAIAHRQPPGESLARLLLRYDAKNEGDYVLHLPKNGLSHQVEVDGQWYEWVDPRVETIESGGPVDSSKGGVSLDFEPGCRHRDMLVNVAGNWRAVPKGKEKEYAARQYAGYATAKDDYGKELVLTPGKHRVRVAVACPSARAPFHGVVRATSEAVDVEVMAAPERKAAGSEDGSAVEKARGEAVPAVTGDNRDAAWGKAVEGVKARLRPGEFRDGHQWLSFDLRNDSREESVHLGAGGMPTFVLIDNVMYKSSEKSVLQLPVRKPGQRITDCVFKLDEKWMAVDPQNEWMSIDQPSGSLGFGNRSKMLELKPGKHTVQAIVYAIAQSDIPTSHRLTRVLSNPVEIEVADNQASDHRDSEQLTVDLIRAEGNLRETPSFWIGYEQLNKDALRERTTRLLQASPGLEVVVRADRAMPHKHVAELLDLLKVVGAKDVSLTVFPLGSVFALDPGPGRDGTIRGKVIGPENRGEVVTYSVTLDHEEWTNRLGELPHLVVAVGEPFEFRNVPAGKCKVRARAVTAPGQDAGVVAKSGELDVIVKNKQVVEVELEIAAAENTDTSEPDAERETDSAKPAAAPTKTTVRGKVVDDATGKPVGNFMIESGKFDPADPAKVVWGYSETRSSRTSGQFSATVRWSEGWTARIVAPGYLPQPILTQPPSPGQDVSDVVIRLKRGDTIRGHVLDHAGKPVDKAGVYLAGRGVIRLAEGPWDELQQATVHTDAEGRFEIGGRGEDSKAIFVTSPSLYVWRADLPQPGQEAIIRLPEPAKLHIRYDIEGGPPAAQVRIELRTWDMPKWNALVDVVRWVDVKPGEDGLVINNLPSGIYDISRIKHTKAGDTGKDMMLDRELKLTLASGKTAAYEFVRKTGMPITGEVAGLPKEGVGGVFLYVRDQRASGDPRNDDDWKLRTFDGLALEGNGSFKTERIPPGKYKVVVEAYKQETPGEMSLSGWRLPKWTGTADVDVVESGDPPKVRVTMHSYDAH